MRHTPMVFQVPHQDFGWNFSYVYERLQITELQSYSSDFASRAWFKFRNLIGRDKTLINLFIFQRMIYYSPDAQF